MLFLVHLSSALTLYLFPPAVDIFHAYNVRMLNTPHSQRKCQEDKEAAASELQDVRTKHLKTKKDVYYLEKALTKARAEMEERASTRALSVGSFLESVERKDPSNQRRKKSLDAFKGKGAKGPAPTVVVASSKADRERLSGDQSEGK